MNNAQKKILIVDDDETNLTMISGILSALYKVYPIDSGAEALEFLEIQRPNLILLDVEMPQMSGTELFRIIKSNPKTSDIPVIFLTGHNDIETEAESFRLGVSDYMRKPVNEAIILARVKMQLELEAYRSSQGGRI